MPRKKAPVKKINKRGRKSILKTKEQEAYIYRMARNGLPQDKIAVIAGMSETALKTHYSDILAKGAAEADGRIMHYAFKLMEQGNVAMNIFLCKVRLGMRENPFEQNKPMPTVNLVFDEPPLPEDNTPIAEAEDE